MEKTAAIYIRVSTDAQREEGYSIEAQKEALTAYCTAKGIKKYEYFIDGGYSGSTLDRPAMNRLIDMVKEDRISMVLVYKLDRLSRSQKDTLYLIEDVLNPHQVSFISLNESMDTGSPMGRLMIGILSAFAQLERENIRERTRMGMTERVKSGCWMGGGNIPYGYDYDSGRGILVPNEDAGTVREIYHLYLEGYSAQNIADRLGLKYDRLVYQILKRPTNMGKIQYNGHIYQGKHEPLVSEEEYERAMLAMEERKGRRRRIENHLLTGLVTCGCCGAGMRYQKWGNKGHKLVCYSHQKTKKYLIRDPECPQEAVWADEVEKAVADDIFSFTWKWSRSEVRTSPEDMLKQQSDKIEKKLKRLYHLYGESGDEALKEAIEETKKQWEKIGKQLKLEEEKKIISRKRQQVLDKAAGLKEVWPQLLSWEKRELILSLVERIYVRDNKIEIVYREWLAETEKQP